MADLTSPPGNPETGAVLPVSVPDARALHDLVVAPAALLPESTGLDRQLLVFRRIAAPLMAAVSETRYEDGTTPTTADHARRFAALIDSTVALSRQFADHLEQTNGEEEGVRWWAACAMADIVGAHYRATSEILTPEQAAPYLTGVESALLENLADLGGAAHDFETDSLAMARDFKAFAPVISSIARFSFGRDAVDMIEEVARRLTGVAIEIAARLRGEDDPGRILNSPLYHAVLEVAGNFYMDSHFAEMDRLLEMQPDERREYVRVNDKKIPMEPVWESLRLRMTMLETLAAHLPEAPEDTL